MRATKRPALLYEWISTASGGTSYNFTSHTMKYQQAGSVLVCTQDFETAFKNSTGKRHRENPVLAGGCTLLDLTPLTAERGLLARIDERPRRTPRPGLRPCGRATPRAARRPEAPRRHRGRAPGPAPRCARRGPDRAARTWPGRSFTKNLCTQLPAGTCERADAHHSDTSRPPSGSQTSEVSPLPSSRDRSAPVPRTRA